MNTNLKAVESQLLGALWGAVVGDALGVPVEFTLRVDLKKNPVTGMRSGGIWKQPAGTWSDDSSLLLCTVDSLIDGFDTEDMGRQFVEWMRGTRWTPHGWVFDIGGTTQDSLSRVHSGIAAEEAGGRTERSNGNGSLMRILPVALASCAEDMGTMLNRVHRVSAITHAHPRSLMACGFYCLVVRGLLGGSRLGDAYAAAIGEFSNHYRGSEWSQERSHFERILSGDVGQLAVDEVESGGYVMDTLTASLWCLLNGDGFADTVLRAVNLARDADTTGCVTGGLAGLYYGIEDIPEEWLKTLARRGDIDLLFAQFLETVLQMETKERSE